MRQRGVDKDINKLLATTPEFIKMCGQSTAQFLAYNATLPLGKKQGVSGKFKAGEKTLRRDISLALPTLPFIYSMIKKKDVKAANRFGALVFSKKTISARKKEAAIKIARRHGFDISFGTFSPSLHKKQRDRKGRVDSVGKVVIQTKSKVETYKRKEAKQIGRAKAGWVAPEAHWYKRRLRWIKRHPAEGSFRCDAKNAYIKNNVPYASEAMIKGGEHRAQLSGQEAAFKAWKKMNKLR